MATLVIFLLVISVLIFVHEAGHFFVAKRAGMKVEEFGFGFPPKLWSFKRGGTEYSINLIPFGGFVRIFGEEGENNRRASGSFGHASVWARTAVVVAGVAMNFLLAVVLLMVSNFAGLRVGLFDDAMISRATDPRVQILQVAPDSPAERGGLQSLDEIIGFRYFGILERTGTPERVQQFAFSHAGEPVTMVIRRGTVQQDVQLALRSIAGPGQGPIGISLALTGVVRYPWYESIWRGIVDASRLFLATLLGYFGILKSLFTDGRLGVEVTGPIGIAALTGQAARIGFTYLMQFVAMISINLAVLNILPFPALDGGRAVLLLAERIIRRPLNESTEHIINTIGFALLLTLMVAVTVKDVVKFF